MIARVNVRLARTRLRARVHAAIRRAATRKAVEVLERQERPAPIPDEKLTGTGGVSEISRDV